MQGLNIAKNILHDENQKIVIVSDNEIIYKSTDRGIKPIFVAYSELKEKMKGSSCADRVVGKAAAWIYKEAMIKELYCEIISSKALNLLQDSGISVEFDVEVPFIQNRDKTGMCPVENLSKNVDDFDILMDKIHVFLKEKNLI